MLLVLGLVSVFEFEQGAAAYSDYSDLLARSSLSGRARRLCEYLNMLDFEWAALHPEFRIRQRA